MHSNFILSQTDGRPMYRQIMEQIKQRVAIGDWPAGAKIPSIRELAVALRVSVITVKRAYLELEREHVIVTQHGKGSFVADDAELGSRLHERELDDYLEKSIRLGALLGLSHDQLIDRLRVAQERAGERSPDEQPRD